MNVSEQTSEQEHMQETKSFVRTNDIPFLKRVTRKFFVVAAILNTGWNQQNNNLAHAEYIYIYFYFAVLVAVTV